MLSVLLRIRYTDSDYPFGIFKLFLSLCSFSFQHWIARSFDLSLLITSLVSSNSSYPFVPFPFGIGLPVLRFKPSDYLFGIFKLFLSLCSFSFQHWIARSFDLSLLITSLVSSDYFYPFVPFSFGIGLPVDSNYLLPMCFYLFHMLSLVGTIKVFHQRLCQRNMDMIIYWECQQ